MSWVIKKRGIKEKFSESKIFESCYAACLQSGFRLDEAEDVSGKVASRVKGWVGKRASVDSSKVLSRVIEELNTLDCPDAAYAYGHIMDLS